MSKILNDDERINLRKMINANETEDFTENIRKNPQSELIKIDLNHLLFLKTKYARLEKSNPEEFSQICISQCKFLYNNYTDIFNKVKKNLIDINIFNNFLKILKQIEDGKIDQHEGSYLVGDILKKIYIDSALKREQHISTSLNNKSKKGKTPKDIHKPKNISYKDYKLMNT
tara:strand:+ start:74 stop:589 length:516 start_codon:yes stop_codon:yes gene_type:complete